MKALEQSDDVYKWGSTPLLSKGLNMMTVLKAKESFSHLQGALLLEAKMLLSIVVVYILILSKHTLLKLQIQGFIQDSFVGGGKQSIIGNTVCEVQCP